MRALRFVTGLLMLLPMFTAARSGAQSTLVPAELQAALFAKILSFDRSLVRATGPPIKLLVLYQTNNPVSRDMGERFAAAFHSAPITSISGRRVDVTIIAVDRNPDLKAAASQSGPDVVYVAPMRAVNIKDIAAIIEACGARGITPMRQYVEGGVAVGVELRAGKPHILVNRVAARAQHMDLSAQLLKLAELIEP